MIDVLNFEKDSLYVKLEGDIVTVTMPLVIREFRAVYDKYEKIEEGYGKKILSYVAVMGHFASPGNIEGLDLKEKTELAFAELGLPEDFKECNTVKTAIAYFDKHYSQGIFGLFKELNRSFKITQSSVEISNSSLEYAVKKLQIKIKDLINEVNTDKDTNVDAILGQLNTITSAIKNVRGIASDLSKDVESLKNIEALLQTEMTTNARPYGGGTVPKSAIPS